MRCDSRATSAPLTLDSSRTSTDTQTYRQTYRQREREGEREEGRRWREGEDG